MKVVLDDNLHPALKGECFGPLNYVKFAEVFSETLNCPSA